MAADARGLASARRGRGNNDFADFAETAGYSFAFTTCARRNVNEGNGRSALASRAAVPNIQGSLREELNLSDAVSGSFRVIREIVVHGAAAR
jgi:hypothetical protein